LAMFAAIAHWRTDRGEHRQAAGAITLIRANSDVR